MGLVVALAVGGAAVLGGLGAACRFVFYGSAEAVGRMLGARDRRRAERRLPPGS